MNKKQERDEFLTEAIDEYGNFKVHGIAINFSTWEGFGKLWEWCNTQEWWGNFCNKISMEYDYDWFCSGYNKNFLPDNFINPDKFANTVYDYLKEIK